MLSKENLRKLKLSKEHVRIHTQNPSQELYKHWLRSHLFHLALPLS